MAMAARGSSLEASRQERFLLVRTEKSDYSRLFDGERKERDNADISSILEPRVSLLVKGGSLGGVALCRNPALRRSQNWILLGQAGEGSCLQGWLC